MKVAQWIDEHPRQAVTVSVDTPLEQAMRRLLKESNGRDLYVVNKEGTIAGRLSHEMLARRMLAEHRPRTTRREIFERITHAPANELMNQHFVTAHCGEDLDEVLARMIDHRIEDLPVVDDDGGILGVVNMTDVLRVFSDE